jgi:hypothetical protein
MRSAENIGSISWIQYILYAQRPFIAITRYGAITFRNIKTCLSSPKDIR